MWVCIHNVWVCILSVCCLSTRCVSPHPVCLYSFLCVFLSLRFTYGGSYSSFVFSYCLLYLLVVSFLSYVVLSPMLCLVFILLSASSPGRSSHPTVLCLFFLLLVWLSSLSCSVVFLFLLFVLVGVSFLLTSGWVPLLRSLLLGVVVCFSFSSVVCLHLHL